MGCFNQEIQEMAAALEAMHVETLSMNLAAMSVFDVSKVTTCITLLATEVGSKTGERDLTQGDAPLLSKLVENITGWWFGCHFLFSHILGIIIPID